MGWMIHHLGTPTAVRKALRRTHYSGDVEEEAAQHNMVRRQLCQQVGQVPGAFNEVEVQASGHVTGDVAEVVVSVRGRKVADDA
jgi:hypothetical protein